MLGECRYCVTEVHAALKGLENNDGDFSGVCDILQAHMQTSITLTESDKLRPVNYFSRGERLKKWLFTPRNVRRLKRVKLCSSASAPTGPPMMAESELADRSICNNFCSVIAMDT